MPTLAKRCPLKETPRSILCMTQCYITPMTCTAPYLASSQRPLMDSMFSRGQVW